MLGRVKDFWNQDIVVDDDTAADVVGDWVIETVVVVVIVDDDDEGVLVVGSLDLGVGLRSVRPRVMARIRKIMRNRSRWRVKKVGLGSGFGVGFGVGGIISEWDDHFFAMWNSSLGVWVYVIVITWTCVQPCEYDNEAGWTNPSRSYAWAFSLE